MTLEEILAEMGNEGEERGLAGLIAEDNPAKAALARKLPGAQVYTPQAVLNNKKLIMKLLSNQQGNVDALNSEIDQIKGNKFPFDLKMIAAASDAYNGQGGSISNVLPGMGEEDRVATIAKLRNLAQDNEQQLIKNLIDMNKSSERGDTDIWKALLGVQGRELSANKKGDTDVAKAGERYRQQFLRDTKDLRDSMDAFGRVDTLAELAKTNPAAAAAVPIQMARAVGEKGVLSDFDTRRWGGSKAVMDRLEQAATELTSGTLTETNAKFLLGVGKAMKEYAGQRFSERENEVADAFASNYDLTPDEAYSRIRGRQKGMERQKKTMAPAAPKAPTGMSDRQKEALDWAKKNPNDPRARQIIDKVTGGGGGGST